jgi:hypothetical protein
VPGGSVALALFEASTRAITVSASAGGCTGSGLRTSEAWILTTEVVRLRSLAPHWAHR